MGEVLERPNPGRGIKRDCHEKVWEALYGSHVRAVLCMTAISVNQLLLLLHFAGLHVFENVDVAFVGRN